MRPKGKSNLLSLVGVPIGNLKDITLRALDVLKGVDFIACEDTRVSLKLLNHYGISKPLLAYHDHNGERMRPRLIKLLKEGKSVAYITDGGMPLISDPGYKLVLACQDQGIPYTVIPGPSAPLTALCLSGLSPARFLFSGFLPPKSAARRRALEDLIPFSVTLIFFESSSRLVDFLKDAQRIFGDRMAAVCRELTKLHEEIRKAPLSTLITHYETHPAKGEIVVLIEGVQSEANLSPQDLDLHLTQLLENHSLKEAVDLMSKAFKLPKREVYQRALTLHTKKESLS